MIPNINLSILHDGVPQTTDRNIKAVHIGAVVSGIFCPSLLSGFPSPVITTTTAEDHLIEDSDFAQGIHSYHLDLFIT